MDTFGAYARILFSVSCAFLLLVALAGRAGGVSFLLPTGDWGSTTHAFVIYGISITATTFYGSNLFAKSSDPDETGMPGGRSQRRPRDFRNYGWDSRLA